METVNNKESWNLAIWIAGLAITAWNGLLTLFLVGLSNQAKEARENIKAVSDEREDHCIPRTECERTHKGVETQMQEIKDGIKGIHLRLDRIYEDKT